MQANHVEILLDQILTPSEIVVLGKPLGNLHRGWVMCEDRVQGAGGNPVGGKFVDAPPRTRGLAAQSSHYA